MSKGNSLGRLQGQAYTPRLSQTARGMVASPQRPSTPTASYSMQRCRSWTPPRYPGLNLEGELLGDAAQSAGSSSQGGERKGCDRELPSGWQRLVAGAYCEATGRPVVDRVRLLETASAPAQQDLAHAIWLHAVVRWADVVQAAPTDAGKGHRTERGEDLTLFVVHRVARDAALAAPQRTSLLGGRLWHVSSVRVLKSMPYQESDAQLQLIGHSGAGLLHLALGLTDAHLGEEGALMPLVAAQSVPCLSSARGTATPASVRSPTSTPLPPVPPGCVEPPMLTPSHGAQRFQSSRASS